MNDSGVDGDYEPNDRIWSAKVDFSGLSAGESAECTASAAGLSTEPLTVTAFPEWSEELEASAGEQAQAAFDAVDNAIAPHVDDESGNIETDEDLDAASADLEQALKGLVEDGTAVSYEVSPGGGDVKLAAGPRCLFTLPIEGMQSSGTDVRVEFWCPEVVFQDPSEGIYVDNRLRDEEVTCRSIIENMPQNSLVWWNGHGYYNSKVGPVLILREKYAHAVDDMGISWEDAVSDRVCWNILDPSRTGIESTADARYVACAAVGAGFFDKYKPNMNGDIFIASVCCGAQSDKLAIAMGRLGCKGFFGFTDLVDFRYNCPFTSELVSHLMEGETLGVACSYSVLINGGSQYEFFLNKFDVFRFLAYLGELNHCKPKVVYGTDYSLKGKNPIVPVSQDVDAQPHDDDIASGAHGTCPWRISADGCLIVGAGELPGGYSYSSWPWYTYRNQITSVMFSKYVSLSGGAGGMFRNCTSLVSVDGLSGWDTSSVTHMGYMFDGCKLIESYPSWYQG